MPVPKKPRRKAEAAPPKAAKAQAVPDRRAMEGFLAAVTGGSADDALSEAQGVMYDAWERTTPKSRIALARKALAISPLCADAYNLLADEAATPAEARDLYLRGLEAGELALGPDGFEEYGGHFWGFLETRPYMRARQGLALALQELGEDEAARGHFRAMLELNPNDNQGIRYLLLASLLRCGDLAGAKALLASYPDEWSAQWLYTRALIAYREGYAAEAATLELVKEARSANEHVPAILAGTRPPAPTQDGYVTMGGPDEATDYVREFGQAWKNIPGAIDWLAGASDVAPPKRRSSKRNT